MTLYQSVSRMWSKLFSCGPMRYLAPLADLTTFLVITAQCIWTFIFIELELGVGLTYDTSAVFGILTATLGFILPLQMNAALGKNKACLDNYNAFLGDIQAFAWDILAFHKHEKDSASLNITAAMFDILIAMPAIAKWHFRGGVDLDKLTTKGGPDFKFMKSVGGYEVVQLAGKMKHMPKPEVCFYKLLDYTKDLSVVNAQQEQGASLRSWERAYGSWGNMGNLDAYTPPVLFTYVLNIALLLYSVLLPFQFQDDGYHAVWMVAIIGYFFLGLNAAGSKVGNAFAEGPQGFQTVTAAQKAATKTMEDIWKCRPDIFRPPLPRNVATNNLVSLVQNQLLY